VLDVLWQLSEQYYISVTIKDVAETRVSISVLPLGSAVCQV